MVEPSEAAADEARLDVVIVSYRSRELLRRCLDSLRAHPPAGDLRTVVVDNAGDDGVAEMVGADYPEVELLRSPGNVGFGAATNAGAALGRAPFVLALNPDAAVVEGTLEVLLGLLERDESIGCAGPALRRDDGSFDHAARRSFPTPLGALAHFSGLGRRVGGGPLAQYRAPEVERGRIDAVNGAFMLLRRSALERIGGFDPGYWMYMEDLDLNYRLAEAGWRTFYEPRATALHTKAGTTGGQRTARLELYFHRGMGRFYRRHYAPHRRAPVNLAIYLGIGAKLALTLLRDSVRADGS